MKKYSIIEASGGANEDFCVKYSRVTIKMPGDTCLVCGNNRSNDAGTSFHRFPSDPERSRLWLRVFQLMSSRILGCAQGIFLMVT